MRGYRTIVHAFCGIALACAATAAIARDPVPTPPAAPKAAPPPAPSAPPALRHAPPPPDEPCRVTTPEALRTTLVRHAHFAFGLEIKFAGGAHAIDERYNRIQTQAVPELVARLKSTTPQTLVARVGQRLGALGSGADATGALVYDFERGRDGKIAFACVWLLDRTGIVASEKTALPGGAPSTVITAAMGLSDRVARVARLRDAPPPAALGVAEQNAIVVETRDVLAETSAQLMPPTIAAGIIARDLKRILILPAIDFGMVPFAALPIATDRLLADQAALVILPQVTSLIGGDGRGDFRFSRPDTPASALIVGNPNLANDPTHVYKPLPEAQGEAEFVASRFGATALTGDGATLARVRRLLTPARGADNGLTLLYFATHGITDPAHPFTRSFVALTGGRLLGDDIKRVRLARQSLVVLSACQTANGRVFEGGAYGLVRSWYYAGAGQIVGSLWSVDDGATSRLMRKFILELETDPRPEFALQKAMRAADNVDRADAALWAPFIVFGDPSAARMP